MPVNFDSYKVFYYVAKSKNITTAANALFLTQPTVSRCIHNLENNLGCILFIRSKKGVTLTPEGKLLFNHIAKAYEHILSAEEELLYMKSLHQGIIRIGASEMTIHYFLLPFLENFHRQFPSIKLKISIYSTPRAISKLKANLIDFAIVSSPIPDGDNLSVTKLASFQDIVIAGRQFLHLADKKIAMKDLLAYPLICLEEDTTTRQYLNSLFEKEKLPLEPDIELTSHELIVTLVKHNLGIGFVPREFASHDLKEGTLLQLSLTETFSERDICAIIDPTHPVSIAGQTFIRLLSGQVS